MVLEKMAKVRLISILVIPFKAEEKGRYLLPNPLPSRGEGRERILFEGKESKDRFLGNNII